MSSAAPPQQQRSFLTALLSDDYRMSLGPMSLMSAARTPRVVTVLYQFGAPVARAGNSNFRPMMTLLYEGYEDSAIQLMFLTVDINDLAMTNMYGSTAFGRAAWYLRSRWFRAVIDHLEAKAEDNDPSCGVFLKKMLNHETDAGSSILMELGQGHNESHQKKLDLLGLLLDHGADPTRMNKRGETFLAVAPARGKAWVDVLEAKGFSSKKPKDSIGKTAAAVHVDPTAKS